MDKEKMVKLKIAMAKLLMKIWNEPDYKAKLLNNPGAFVKELGYTLKKGMRVELHADTKDREYLVLPMKPNAADLSEEIIKKLAQGTASQAELEEAINAVSCSALRYLE